MVGNGLGDIADVGAAFAAGSFIQGVDELRHLVWESPLSKRCALPWSCVPLP
jgi:hypothetical protein